MNLLDYLTDEERLKLRAIDFEKGEILCHEGDLCEGIHFVEKGRIKIASYSLNGNEIVYNTLGPGGMFGNHLAFASVPYYRGNAIGEESGRAYYLKKSDAIDIFRENPSFLEHYLTVLSDFGKQLNAKIHLLSLSTGKERLEYYLYMNQGKVSFRSVSALAKELSISREACSRLLCQLERDGAIRRDKNQITRRK